MLLDTWQSPTNLLNQMTIDSNDDLKKVVCGSYQQIADVHSQSAMSPTERHKMRWRVIGVCKGVHGRWLPTEDCPYLGSRDPLGMARTAVENGDLITAQKKIGMHHYELWAQTPKTMRKA
jgi:hypothetical protein